MTLLPITIATWDYDRVRALMTGAVGVEGCDVRHLALEPEECFHRAWGGEFDVCELGLCSYLVALHRNKSPFVAIPVFTSRMFRHSAVYVRKDRGLDRPSDLKGKTVGVPQYEMAAAVWARGFLSEDFGVRASDVEWVQGGLEEPGRRGAFPMSLPPEISLRAAPDGQSLSRMLADGALDALVTARAPSCFVEGAAGVRRLFADCRRAEIEYFERSRVFPIMHVVGVRRALVEQNPWLPTSLVKAFTAAKRLAEAELREVNALKVGLPWAVAEMEATERLMGRDFWPYGVEANRHALETLARHVEEQGILPHRIAVEEMFAPSTLKELKI
jgi:4,5-dihydroxyphthalate decarboxylase